MSQNVKGLGTSRKRLAILTEIDRANPSVFFLQESQFQKGEYPRFSNKKFDKVFHTGSPDKRCRG